MDSWEQHKDVLRTLYSSKDRKIGTLRSIMVHMEANHNFVRSKGQFERQFKKWGFRKYSTSEHWKTIHGKIQKRHAQGKKSAVYKSGKHVQVEKLNREKRHNFRKAEDLFSSGRSVQTACCVEKYCQHAMEELPGTPAGFTVCTPMGETSPPLLINNLPSLQLYHRLKSFVFIQPKYPNDPRYGTIDDLSGNDQAAFADATSQPYQFFDQRVVASANNDITTSATLLGEEFYDNDVDFDLKLLRKWELESENWKDLFQVSRTGGLSPLVIPMLYRASNNLLSWDEASSLVDLIIQGSDRRVFNALISTRSPATQAIARSLLPAAMKSPDLELVRSLLETGVSPDAPIDNSLMTTLQFAVAEGNSDERISDIVQLLLDYGARVNLPWARDTSSLLVYAAGQGHLGLVQLLLAAGADVNAHASACETTALQAAAGARVGFRAPRVATKSDRLAISQLLLNAGADVNAHPDKGQTALQAAVKHENVMLVQMLLSYGANANAPAVLGSESALRIAASTGNLETIDLLLKWGALDVLSALESASQKGHQQAAQVLFSFWASLDDPDDEAQKRMALRVGIRFGDYHFVQGLLESMVDLDARAGTDSARQTAALQLASAEGDIDLVRLLISFGADVNAPAVGESGSTALQSAALKGNTKLVRILLDAGAVVNDTPSTCGMMALESAAAAGSLETVQVLLESGADTFVQGAAATVAAIEADDGSGSSAKIVQVLLGSIEHSGVNGPDTKFDPLGIYKYFIDCELMSLLLRHRVLGEDEALLYAIERCNPDLVKLALDLDARIDARVLDHAVLNDGHGFMQLLLEHEPDPEDTARALQYASSLGLFEEVELLIHARADVNAAPLYHAYSDRFEEGYRRTALQGAAQYGHLEVVRMLLEGGAEVERSSISVYEDGTALQFAAMSGSIAIANELIQKGANVNAPPMGEDGRTALEGAAEHGRLDMVQLLLNLEAEKQGSRALQLARDEGHDGVAMLLLENGFEDDDDWM